MKAEAERRYGTWAGMMGREIARTAFIEGAQFSQEGLRDYYMAEFQDLHDNHGCPYLDKARELKERLKTARDRLSEVKNERATVERLVSKALARAETAENTIKEYATAYYAAKDYPEDMVLADAVDMAWGKLMVLAVLTRWL